ncbi:hypothetical protein MF672_038820 [Actinomadura sp. ATCC 31491]|uniref:Minor tail protein n=1 Tax=Actinomadura luzonensis TaxID=2805427 RepID=A0ABT0G529_9ACTN|nr:hypothetical protein [Actinomadura luzonensis]MCK2219707.1 hypothetical protein [Actinomadura luzonensis]
MATRHNLCVNPCLTNNATGWGGEATPARAAVTGFDRPNAAEYTAGTFIRTAGGAAVAGQEYTLSVYVRPNNAFSAGGNIYVEWRNASDGVISYSNGSYSLTANVVTRASVTATAPAGAATAQIILDGTNYTVTTVHATMCLIEAGSVLGDYFDGDSPSAAWDGTPGNSSSTLEDAITGTLAAALPPLGAAAGASVRVPGAVAATLPGLAAGGDGGLLVRGPVAGGLPSLSASAAGQTLVQGQAAAGLPPLSAAAGAAVFVPGGPVTAGLPPLAAGLAAVSEVAELDVPVRVGSPRLGWPVGVASLSWSVGPPVLGGE